MRRHFDSRVTRLANLAPATSIYNAVVFEGAADFARRRRLLIRPHQPDIVSNGTGLSIKK
jgi:hypothetical protein